MWVKVTQEDIDNGRRMSIRSCPVALALQRTCPGDWSVSGRWLIYQNRVEIDTPRAVGVRIEEYDDGAEMHPFSFQIRNPC